MGLNGAPDIFQDRMSELVYDLEYARAYLDDLLCLTNGSFQDHLSKLDTLLTRLTEAGLKANINKNENLVKHK